MKLFRIPQTNKKTLPETTATAKPFLLNFTLLSFTVSSELNTADKSSFSHSFTLSKLNSCPPSLTVSLTTHISVRGLAGAPGSCWHTLGVGVEGFASSADRPAWRGGHSTTAEAVLRPTWSRKEKERNIGWIKRHDLWSELYSCVWWDCRGWLRARQARFLTADLIGKACLQLPASQLRVLNDKHTPALGQYGQHRFRAEHRLLQPLHSAA